MSSALENVNNAIHRMQFVATSDPNVAPGTLRAVDDLAAHWQRFVWSKILWRTLAPMTLAVLAQGYIRWYAQAFYLLPASARSKLIAPRDVDADLATFADDEVKRIANAGQAVANYVENSVREAAPVLAKVASGAGVVLSEAGKLVLILGGVAVAVLIAIGYARRGR